MYQKTLEETLTFCFEAMIQYMITHAIHPTDDSRDKESFAYNIFEFFAAQTTSYNAGTLPNNVLRRARDLDNRLWANYMKETHVVREKLAYARDKGNEDEIRKLLEVVQRLHNTHKYAVIRTGRRYFQHCWNVVHDPKLVVRMSEENKKKFQDSLEFFADIMHDPPTLEVLSLQKKKIDAPAWQRPPERERRGAPAWQPPPERERRGAPSAASEAFLEKRRMEYVNALHAKLQKALSLENNEKYKGVYTAYKDAFGQMLSEAQAHCFTGKTFEEPAEGDVEQATPKKPSWMQLQAAENVTKARWLLVLKESNALWHAVVVKFRALYQNFNLRGEFQDVRVSEEEQYADGASIPAHHISDLRILCGRNFVDVARGRWSAYIRKEFATNTVHFLREYQTRLMERFATSQEKLFGFWFYPSDLCDWVRDIREAAALKNAPAEARAQGEAATRVADRSAAKRFRWPACCKKGNNLQDADSITTPAYKAFCQQNGLWSQSRNSRLQFCQRMRAAWLRVVDAYEFQDGEPPSNDDIITYLNKQKIFEVRLEKNAAGRMSAVDEVVYILKDPARHTTKELRAEMPTRRVLVYGAPLVNPYLCGPRL